MKKILIRIGGLVVIILLGQQLNIDKTAIKEAKNNIYQDLSLKEKDGLIQMREEEKLARDVYTTLGKKRGTQIFMNIAQSEQTHTDAVKGLLDKYNIEDPVIDNTIGSFTSPDMKKLYEELTLEGEKSLLQALMVGATIEDLDIYDLNKLTQETQNRDIQRVYSMLKSGSEKHMNAFVKNITNNSSQYIPQYISQSEYNTIISSSQGNRGKGGY